MTQFLLAILLFLGPIYFHNFNLHFYDGIQYSPDLSLADTLSEAAVVSSVLGAASLGVSRYWAGAHFYIISNITLHWSQEY